MSASSETLVSPGPKPRRFASADSFRAWLERHHRAKGELLVRCYKNHAKDRGLTYSQALDEALCFGWIDGVRRSLDADSFSVRFTPRRAQSKWSDVNIRHARRLEAEGRMPPAGLAAFRARKKQDSRRYSFESRPVELDPAYARKLRSNRAAWKFFQSQPPWYQRVSKFWIMSAKREETCGRRLDALIASSQAGERIGPLRKQARSPKPRR